VVRGGSWGFMYPIASPRIPISSPYIYKVVGNGSPGLPPAKVVVTRVVRSGHWGVYACINMCYVCVNRRCARGGFQLGWTKVGQCRVRCSDSWFLLVFMLAYLMVQTHNRRAATNLSLVHSGGSTHHRD
jgi:hypothetical protein